MWYYVSQRNSTISASASFRPLLLIHCLPHSVPFVPFAAEGRSPPCLASVSISTLLRFVASVHAQIHWIRVHATELARENRRVSAPRLPASGCDSAFRIVRAQLPSLKLFFRWVSSICTDSIAASPSGYKLFSSLVARDSVRGCSH